MFDFIARKEKVLFQALRDNGYTPLSSMFHSSHTSYFEVLAEINGEKVKFIHSAGTYDLKGSNGEIIDIDKYVGDEVKKRVEAINKRVEEKWRKEEEEEFKKQQKKQ